MRDVKVNYGGNPCAKPRGAPTDTRLANVRYRNRWKRVTVILSVIVALLTLAALMLPALTMNRLLCGKEEHTHTDSCYSADGSTVCGKEEHLHTDACTEAVDLTEEEIAEVNDMILMIDILPTKTEIEAKLAEFDEKDDGAGKLAYSQKTSNQIGAAFDSFYRLSEPQRSAVTNSSKLFALKWLPADEQDEVDEVISLINGLPQLDEVKTDAAAYEAAGDRIALKSLFTELTKKTDQIREIYDGFNYQQKNCVTNSDVFIALETWLTGENEKLAEAEGKVIAEVEDMIDDLPDIDSAKDELAKLEASGDAKEIAEYKSELLEDVTEVRDSYNDLLISQKESVTNADKLSEYIAWLKELGLIPENEYEVKHYIDETYTQVCDNRIHITLVGDLPEGAEVKAFPTVAEQNEAKLLCAFDISIFLPDGTEYQPTKPVQVTYKGISPSEDADIVVYHVDEDGRRERVPTEWDGDKVTFTAEHFSVYAAFDMRPLHSIAESGDPDAVQELIDSGFFTYWSDAVESTSKLRTATYPTNTVVPRTANYVMLAAEDDEPSDSQITNEGGEKNDGTVRVSKTIDGTDIENVFDITLTVDTTTKITELQKDPDMAVVIVMDISNTMNGAFGGSTRYKAAIESAEAFLDRFAAESTGYSKVGYVAFNTDAHQIFDLSDCDTAEQATALKNTMRTETGKIITASDYGSSHNRFTNIEAGLKMGYDMLAKTTNANKYIIFLSDGFPTTYVKSGYTGYDPYTSSGTKGADGVFYDYVTGYYCAYGTSYSDKAAIRAREMATKIKNAGATIFSIGVDVGGQTIAGYDVLSGLSVIDRTGTTYELGSATDTNAFENWLGNSIGSGYYYDSTNTAGLQAAYDQIFAKIKSLTEEANKLKWIASDPIPEALEFVGFYNIKKELQVFEPITNLIGSGTVYGENMISYDSETRSIAWNLKQSGYSSMVAGDTTWYSYSVTYRVRLKNELDGFVEHQSYDTNGKTALTYQNVTIENGKETISGDRTVEFPIPAVKGYLGELTFKKVTPDGSPLVGAVFELRHDETACPLCRGDGKTYVAAVEERVFTATSGEDGIVTFTRIPSGHKYTLVETVVPDGYYTNGSTYEVTVAYDAVTVTETSTDGATAAWDLTNRKVTETDKNGTQTEREMTENEMYSIVNLTTPELPATGGKGASLYIFGGLAIMTIALALMYITKRKVREGGQ